MPNLIVIARIKAQKGDEEIVKKGLLGLIAPTLEEEGCIKYELNQDSNEPGLFVFIEEWESMEHLQKHSKSQHIKAFGAAMKGKIESRELQFLEKI